MCTTFRQRLIPSYTCPRQWAATTTQDRRERGSRCLPIDSKRQWLRATSQLIRTPNWRWCSAGLRLDHAVAFEPLRPYRTSHPPPDDRCTNRQPPAHVAMSELSAVRAEELASLAVFAGGGAHAA